MRQKILKQKKGFTLIEILVSLSILGIILLLLVSMMNNFFRSGSRVKNIEELQNLNNLIINDLLQEVRWSNEPDGDLISTDGSGSILNIVRSNDAKNISYYVSGEKLVKETGGNGEILTTEGVKVNDFTVENFSETDDDKVKLLKITVGLESESTGVKISTSKSIVVSLRKKSLDI